MEIKETKLPCIYIENNEIWKKIYPSLIAYGYKLVQKDYEFDRYPMIGLAPRPGYGICFNYRYDADELPDDHGYKLCNSIEEFLKEAAYLSSRIPKFVNHGPKINNIELKPGRVIEIKENDKTMYFLVTPMSTYTAVIQSEGSEGLIRIEDFYRDYYDKITAIFDNPEDHTDLRSGKLLWKKNI